MSRPAALLLLAAVAATPALAQDLGTDEQREAGRVQYEKYCSQCHGETGNGLGYATLRLKPAPRDFTSGKFKIRTTPSGALPTDDDLHKVIRNGLPYTSMPAWPNFTDKQIQEIIYYIKTFSEDFSNPERYQPPIDIPEPPASSDESIARGKEIYGELGCGGCHGELGRGDGTSAPTLADDWGQQIRPADMTMRWMFRGGPTRKDIFRTFSTGLNGTPMPSYADALEVDDRWHLVNYIYSLGEADTPNYSDLLQVPYVAREIDLSDAEALDELFATSPPARFPLIGQIIEPGRDFYPATTSLVARAVYNPQEIAIELRWHDMRAETTGHNAPDLVAPPWDEQQHMAPTYAEPSEPAGGGEESGGFWGVEEKADEGGGGGGEADFWGTEEEGTEQAAAGPDTEFSDAVAIQFPQSLPTGIRKPYFIFGDAQNPVDLWFVDLARKQVETYTGRGSADVVAAPGDDIDVVASYDHGEWRVVYKRSLRSANGITFGPEQFVPIAFSLWDGFYRERGNKRALSRWLYLYLEPSQKVSVAGPMIEAALAALVIELLIVFLVRRWYARKRSAAAPGPTGAMPHGGMAR